MTSYSKTANASLNILIRDGRIYSLDATSIKKKFEVKGGSATSYAGTLYYNDSDDLSGNQVGATSTDSQNRAVVIFTKGTKEIAKFVTADSPSDPVTPKDNAGAWQDL
ncbi:hypothetical protein FA15DRAFT_757170 [Coprinopsis marcescibilis]|uniref:Uncharacterized protein n=1 Tax=Coprinopsis marcescibilis TaxID=230819 RepID=A0A5C3KSB8_COPMA|nr:hypothetical protein FA15DRAFT_757170 [Coprinopsis marcescibilis]